MKTKSYIKMMMAVMAVLLIAIAGIAYKNDFYASENFSDTIVIADEKGAVYRLLNIDGQTEIWKFSQNDKRQSLVSGDQFDHAFCSEHIIYFTKNKGSFYAFQMSETKYGYEFADVSLGNDYMMTATNDAWYFTDKAIPNVVIKCDYRHSQNEEIILDSDVKILLTDIETKKVFALTDKGVTDVDTKTLISCAIPVLPLKSNNNIYTDSIGDKYSFSSKSGFQKILDTGYDKICASKNSTYALSENCIYSLDENGDILSVYRSDIYLSDIIASGSNLYALTDTDVVYIPPKSFTAYQKEISQTEISNQEPSISHISESSLLKRQTSRSNISVNENSETVKKTEVSLQESSKPEYIIESDVYDISEEKIYLPQGTTIAELKIGMRYGDYQLSFVNHNGKVVTGGQMGTGWKVNFIGNGEIKSYYTIVLGDVTGEGNINTKDMYLLRDYLFGKTEFSDYQREAADLKKNEIIDSVDLYFLVKELKNKGIL